MSSRSIDWRSDDISSAEMDEVLEILDNHYVPMEASHLAVDKGIAGLVISPVGKAIDAVWPVEGSRGATFAGSDRAGVSFRMDGKHYTMKYDPVKPK